MKKKIIYGISALGSLLAIPALAAPTSSPIEVMGVVVDNGINSAVSLITTVMTTYFPYIIAIVATFALLRWVFKLAKAGSH